FVLRSRLRWRSISASFCDRGSVGGLSPLRFAIEAPLAVYRRFVLRSRLRWKSITCLHSPNKQKDAPKVQSVLCFWGMVFIFTKLFCFEFEFAVCYIDFEVQAFDQVARDHFAGERCFDVSGDEAFQ